MLSQQQVSSCLHMHHICCKWNTHRYQLPYKTAAGKLVNWQKWNISCAEKHTRVIQDFVYLYNEACDFQWARVALFSLLTFVLVRVKAMPCCSKREQNAYLCQITADGELWRIHFGFQYFPLCRHLVLLLPRDALFLPSFKRLKVKFSYSY